MLNPGFQLLLAVHKKKIKLFEKKGRVKAIHHIAELGDSREIRLKRCHETF